jgi:glycosyltransferase involved in cell wall biosynthesis
VPWHWSKRDHLHESKGDLDRIGGHGSVTTHGPMTFSNFQRFLSTIDVTIDLFQHNLEREYAMVTRAVVSLAAGVPVIHPPFTEVSEMIADYDAGWLVDAQDTKALGSVLDEVLESPDALRQKTKNARTLARAVIDPAEAVRPLVGIMESW